jgi:DNA-binding transcriptional ArsR family regulator
VAYQGVPVNARLSPGHAQVLISLGVSPPTASQLLDRLAEHPMVERRRAPEDRRVELVDHAPGVQDLTLWRLQERRRRLGEATHEEGRALLKGSKLLVEGFAGAEKEKAVGPHR